MDSLFFWMEKNFLLAVEELISDDLVAWCMGNFAGVDESGI